MESPTRIPPKTSAREKSFPRINFTYVSTRNVGDMYNNTKKNNDTKTKIGPSLYQHYRRPQQQQKQQQQQPQQQQQQQQQQQRQPATYQALGVLQCISQLLQRQPKSTQGSQVLPIPVQSKISTHFYPTLATSFSSTSKANTECRTVEDRISSVI